MEKIRKSMHCGEALIQDPPPPFSLLWRLVTHSFESPREIQTQEPSWKLTVSLSFLQGNGGKRSKGQR